MESYFIGIDISKSWIDLVVYNQEIKLVNASVRYQNNLKELSRVLKSLIKRFKKDQLWFCFEHTGSYGMLLTSLLEQKQLNYSAVPALEIKNSLGITRGKNDKVDADRIARYAATNRARLKKSRLNAPELLKIKDLLTYRSQLVKMRTGLKNSLKSYQINGQIIDNRSITQGITLQIKDLDQRISELEKEIRVIIKSQHELNENFENSSSVKGVGLILAANLLVATKNFSAFDNPRKFNCYSGLAPFEHSSGTFKGKTRTSMLRNRAMKTLLFSAANSAARYDQQLKNYYIRKKEEGKHHHAIINAIACKLTYRIFACVKRKGPYLNLDF